MSKRGRLVAGLLMALALAGCTVGPDYMPPITDPPPAWRTDLSEANQLSNSRWWQQFDDPVLDRLIKEALLENRDLWGKTVVGWVALQAPFHGSPVADNVPPDLTGPAPEPARVCPRTQVSESWSSPLSSPGH